MAGEWLPPTARRIVRRDFSVAVGPPLVLVVAAFGVTMFFVKPAPQKKITMAIASDEGGSRYYARRYQEILKRNGITLDVRQTNGSLANVRVLAAGGADVAFVQSGTDPGQSGGHHRSQVGV